MALTVVDVVTVSSGGIQLAPNLTQLQQQDNGKGYSVFYGTGTGGLQTVLNLTGKFAIYLLMTTVVGANVNVILTVDGEVIYTGAPLPSTGQVVLHGYDSTTAIDPFICESSLKLELDGSTLNNGISVVYLVKALK